MPGVGDLTGGGLSVVMLVCIASTAFVVGTVSWDKGSPSSPAAGQVTGSGTYTEDKGFTPDACFLNAVPTSGGKGYLKTGLALAGKWGPITIDKLPKGKYTVIATINFKDSTGKITQIYSPTAFVDVP